MITIIIETITRSGMKSTIFTSNISYEESATSFQLVNAEGDIRTEAISYYDGEEKYTIMFDIMDSISIKTEPEVKLQNIEEIRTKWYEHLKRRIKNVEINEKRIE